MLATRVITGLITVWCLGCSGFDPLLSALLGSTRAMNCVSEMSAATGSQPGTVSIQDSSPERGFDCGCDSCYAASPVMWIAMSDEPQRPEAMSLAVVEPVSITRIPSVPPPESSAL